MRIAIGLALLAGAIVFASESVSVWDGVYVEAQSARGKALYGEQCADCHGADAKGVRGPDLTGLWSTEASDERVVEMPDDLASALKKDKEAKRAFDALAFTHRKEYARWVGGAKRNETRAARIGKTLVMLKAGTKHP